MNEVTGTTGLLVLADGTVVRGMGVGAEGVTSGELVFQTGMVGYQEALTDPSYAGQLLIYTYPLVGNYGAGPSMSQSSRIYARGAIVRDLMPSSGHRNATQDFDAMLKAEGIPVLAGVDTRFLTRKVRTHGVLPAALAVGPEASLPSVEELQQIASGLDYDSCDFVSECSTQIVEWLPPSRPDAPRIAFVDYGAKYAMLSHFTERGAGVWVLPARTPSEEILALQPDGIFLSNGPGDPAHLDYAVESIRGLLQNAQVPVFGICLGHQLLALAAGGRTTKMRFGHRGVNQPVLDLDTGRVAVTTQNHGYVVEGDSLPEDFRVTHTNLNDGSVEGIAHISKPVWSVQWHPEANPGPRDTRSVLDKFLLTVEAGVSGETKDELPVASDQ